MVGKIQVNPAELAKASREIETMSQNYSRIYKSLIQCAETMSAWEGSDNQAFVQQIQGLTEELNSMAQKLRVASEALGVQSKNYTDRQDDNIKTVRSLTN